MTHALEFQHIYAIRQGTPVLQDLSFHIPTGGLSVVLGGNGCGKSTLMQLATGLLWPKPGGTIHTLGQTLGQCDMLNLRKRIALVSPSSGPAGSSMGVVCDPELRLIDAVCTGFFGSMSLYQRPTKSQRHMAIEIIQQLDLGHRLRIPLCALSSGEQRKALFARALIMQPDMLILDEPTAGLDIGARETFLQSMQHTLAANNPPTIILITHHVEEILPQTKHIVLIHQGRCHAQGTPQEVLTNTHLSSVFECDISLSQHQGRYWAHARPQHIWKTTSTM